VKHQGIYKALGQNCPNEMIKKWVFNLDPYLGARAFTWSNIAKQRQRERERYIYIDK
jgi:hypothetical protein